VSVGSVTKVLRRILWVIYQHQFIYTVKCGDNDCDREQPTSPPRFRHDLTGPSSDSGIHNARHYDGQRCPVAAQGTRS
jgi:hypothetical protein